MHHTEIVGVVRNLTMGSMSPQYHLVYDDWFETVNAMEVAPPELMDLCVFHKFQVVFDNNSPKPVLEHEWN